MDESQKSHSTYVKKAKKPRRQKTTARIEAANWHTHKYHADFQLADSKDRINYDELGADDVEYDYLIQEEYASSWIYPVNLLMENGRLCSWRQELESWTGTRALDLSSILDDALKRRSERMQRDLERCGWSVIRNESCLSPEMGWNTDWDDFEDFEIV
jgi:hypothetical protein